MKTKSGVQQKTSNSPKKATKAAPSTSPSIPSVNGTATPAAEVLTLREAAEFLRVAEVELKKLADAGKLPGRKVGEEWRVLKSALCEWLTKPEATDAPVDWRESNRRLLELAGSWKDDETLPEMIEEIYKERKRHLVGEIQD